MKPENFLLELSSGAKICAPSDINCLTTYVILEKSEWFEKEIALLPLIIEKGMNCVDIGACYGVYTVEMAELVGPNGSVFAFEPNLKCMECLAEAPYENIKVNNDALFDSCVPFRLSSDLAEYKNIEIFPEGGANQTTITLDEWWRLNDQLRLDVIKVDASDSSLQVLVGAKKVLEENQLILIIAINKDFESIKSFLEICGYQLFLFNREQQSLEPLNDDNDLSGSFSFVACKYPPDLIRPVVVKSQSGGIWDKLREFYSGSENLVDFWEEQIVCSLKSDYLRIVDFLIDEEYLQAENEITKFLKSNKPTRSILLNIVYLYCKTGRKTKCIELVKQLVERLSSHVNQNCRYPFLTVYTVLPLGDCSFSNGWVLDYCNRLLLELSCCSTYFLNPSKIDDLRRISDSYVSAKKTEVELALFSLKNNKCYDIDRFKSIAFEWKNGNHLHRLLKTNYEAKNSFVSSSRQNDSSDEVLEIVNYHINPVLTKSALFQQVYEEILTLAYWVSGFRPHNFLEIGFKGATFHILSHFSTGSHVAIDYDDSGRALLAHFIGYDKNFKFINDDSHSLHTFACVKNFCNSFDLIFIDGDHSYDGVKKDFEMYSSLLSKRGCIIFHDIDPDHVFKDGAGGAVYQFWKDLDVGSKVNLISSRSSGRISVYGHSYKFGGIGLWFP